MPPAPPATGTTIVSGPGQNRSASFPATSGQSAANRRAVATSAACAISGFVAGRPLAAKTFATAAAFVASAPRP